MKKLLLSCMALATAMLAAAQDIPDNALVLDAAEDTTQIITIQDIINVQEVVTSSNSNAAHFKKVWSRNSFFNLNYNSAKLTPKENVPLGCDYNGGFAPEFKSDWGAALVLGHSYCLHKKPIANIVEINLDYTYIDLNLNHYKAEDGEKLYNSNNQWQSRDDDGNTTDYYYTPWCLEKYEANYGMTLGPSVTVAPFTYLNIPQLHFVKFNIYFHVGYHVSLLWMQNDKNKDINFSKNKDEYNRVNFDKVDNALKMDWGHGLSTTFGFSVTWKSIGIGYETRSGKFDYKAMQGDVFGKNKYKFDASTSRVYLSIRY